MLFNYDGDDELESEISAMAASDDDGNSIEDRPDKIQNGKLLSTMRLVSLPEQRDREFEAFFYPGKTKFKEIFESASLTMGQLNAFYRVMRYIFRNANNLSQMSEESRTAAINTRFAETFASCEPYITQDIKKFWDNGNKLCSAHVIPSNRYTGGFDIIYSMEESSYGLGGVMAGTEDTMAPEIRDTFASDNARFNSWLAPVGEQLAAAAEEIYAYLFETKAPTVMNLRHAVPLTFDFSKVQKIFESHLQIQLDKQYIENIFFSFEEKLSAQFMQLDLHSFASSAIVQNTYQYMRNEEGQVSTADRVNRLNALMQDKVDTKGLFINVLPVATFRLTLEEDICRYVSQSEDSRQVSTPMMANWFKVWRSQYWKSGGEVQIAADLIPRYMLAPSALASLPARRKANGYVSENTRANDDGLYISSDGTFRCRPSAEQYQTSTTAKDFEALSGQFLNYSDRFLDIPEAYITHADRNAKYEILTKLKEYENVNLAHDWDSGTELMACGAITKNNGNDDNRYAQFKGYRTIGSVQPDSLAIADFVGFDFARDGEKPIRRTFSNAMYSFTNYLEADRVDQAAESVYGSRYNVTAMTGSHASAIRKIMRLYMQMAYVENKAPKIEELLAQAYAEVGLSEEPDAVLNRYDSYSDYMQKNGMALASRLRGVDALVTNLLDIGLTDVSSVHTGALYIAKRRELAGGTNDNVPVREILEELENDDRYFVAHTSPTDHFKRVYNTFGGRVYKLILDALIKFPVTYFMNQIAERKRIEYPDGSGYEIVLQTNTEIMNHVYPALLMLAKYVPNSEQIFAEAKAITESLEPDPGFTTEDMKVPGVEDERFIYPHQVATQAHLRRPIPPSFAILALEPGGGKTGQGAIDVATLIEDVMEQKGERVVPMIIAPNGLLSTWAGDIKYFFGDKYNVFPINSDTKQRWSQEELLEKVRTAPINTIYLVSMQYLQSNSVRVSIGERNIQVSANIEFIKQIGANYIAIDESHNLKSLDSARHRYIKQITTSPQVKWLRLLTGTLMPDRAKDIEGQVALYSPHIFRAGEIANVAAGAATSVDGDTIESSNKLNGERALTKLSRYCAFIVKKRKEWAFMLPIPIEEVYEVSMVNPSASDEEQALQRLHEEMYKFLLDKTLESLEEEMSAQAAADKAKERASKRKRKSDDEGEESDSDDGRIVEDEDYAELASLDKAGWDAHVANFIRMCTAPQSLPEEFKAVFGEDRGKDFVPNKVKAITNLVNAHFNPPIWNRDGKVKYYTKEARPLIEYDMVKHEGKLYIVRKFTKGTKRAPLPASEYTKTPDQNPDYWKEEPEGKLIIVTRYDSTGNSIYDALPEHYKSKAVVFNGTVPDPKSAFQRFKTSGEIQILIANEQRITEGYNLQLASRIIRVELPWGPGAISQTQARILRPDPKARQQGRITRDVIYLDHVLTENSVETAQFARIIMKTFGTYKLTECNNPMYKDLLAWDTPDPSQVPELKLGAKMLKNRLGFGDDPFNEMYSKMSDLLNTQNLEFLEMKQTQSSEMSPLYAAPQTKGSAKEKYLPYVENQPIADPKKWNPVPVEQFIEEHHMEDLKDLIGLPAITEFGTGMVVGYFTKRGTTDKLSGNGIKIRLKDPMPGRDEFLRTKPTLVMIPDPSKMSAADLEADFKVDLHSTPTAQKRADAEARRLEKQQREQEEREEQEEQIRKSQESKRAAAVRKTIKDGEKRRENVKEGKPANEGIVYTTDNVANVKLMEGKVIPPKSKVEPEPEIEDEVEVYLHPAYYHGFTTIEATSDWEIDLKKFGFTNMGPYAFVQINNKHRFRTIAEWMHNTFDMSDKTVDRIMEIDKAFEAGDRNLHKLWYKLELAPISTLPAFFQLRKKLVENRNEVRVYPVFTEDHLMLCVDIRTNPAIVKYLGKTIPGAAAKWQRSDGHWFYFGKNKSDLKTKIAEVAKAMNVVNVREAQKEAASLPSKR